MTKVKKYSKEFKLDAIALIVEHNYYQIESAINFGINRLDKAFAFQGFLRLF